MDPVIKIIIEAINNSRTGLREAERDLGGLRTRIQEVDAETRRYLESNLHLGQGFDEISLSMAEQENQYAQHRDQILENSQALQDLGVTNDELRESITRVVDAERERSAAEAEAYAMNEQMADSQRNLKDANIGTYESVRQGTREFRQWMTTLGTFLVIGRAAQRIYQEIEKAAEKAAESGLVVADAYKEEVKRGEENIDMGIRALPVITALTRAKNDLAEAGSELTDQDRTLIEAEQAGIITFDQMNAVLYARANRLQLIDDLVTEVTPDLEEYKRKMEEAAKATGLLQNGLSDLKKAMGMTSELDSWDASLVELEQHAEDLKMQLRELGVEEYISANSIEQGAALRSELVGIWTEYNNIQDEIDSGDLGERKMGIAKERAEELRAKMGEVEGKLRQLGLLPYLTPEQLTEIEDLQGQLDETKNKIAGLATQHSLMIREMIFGLAEARVAAYLTSDDYDEAIGRRMVEDLRKVAEGWGLVRDDTLGMLLDSGEAIDAFIAGDLSDLQGELNKTARRYQIVFDISTSWKPPEWPDWAGGGSGAGPLPPAGYDWRQPPPPSVPAGGDPPDIPTASGGRRRAGERLLLGELGREVWVPDRDGTVIPNNELEKMMGGGSGVRITMFSPVFQIEGEVTPEAVYRALGGG